MNQAIATMFDQTNSSVILHKSCVSDDPKSRK